MGQGVTISHLGAHSLSTGYGTNLGDNIQSCSAVFLWNTTTNAAGCFHFPAGNVFATSHSGSAGAMNAMAQTILADAAHINYGTLRNMIDGRGNEPADDYAVNLRDFVKWNLLRGGRPAYSMNKTGKALIRRVQGMGTSSLPQIKIEEAVVYQKPIDLSGQASGLFQGVYVYNDFDY